MSTIDLLPEIPKKIVTDRLVIRACDPAEAEKINTAVLETFDELHRWMPWAKNPQTVEEAGLFLSESVKKFANKEEFHFSMFLKTDESQFIGGVGIHHVDWKARKFELGYWGRNGFQGNGFVSEAVKALIDILVRDCQAKRLLICCDERNVKSAAVAIKLGFVLEKSIPSEKPDNFGNSYSNLFFSKTF